MFTKFGELPIELRLKIWRHAAQQPRIIGLRSSPKQPAFAGTNARCPLLIVSKEAREEAMKSRKDFNRRMPRLGRAKIYADLEIDTLWLADLKHDAWEKLGSGEVKNIQRLAISYDDFVAVQALFKYSSFKNSRLDNLKDIVAIVRSETIGENDEAVFIVPRYDIPLPMPILGSFGGVSRYSDGWEEDAHVHNSNIVSSFGFWTGFIC